MTTFTVPTMTYRPCATCTAPIVDPFPDTWTFDLVKEGPREGPVATFGTPHRPDCGAPVANPEPGIAVRISGQYVERLDLVFPTPGGHR